MIVAAVRATAVENAVDMLSQCRGYKDGWARDRAAGDRENHLRSPRQEGNGSMCVALRP